MQSKTLHLNLDLPSCLYLKNPESSDLGKRILIEAASFIGSNGIDEFNFLKLAKKVGCTEATVYRYFHNKQQLVQYLLNIYWGSICVEIEYSTRQIKSARKKLKTAIEILSSPHPENFTDNKLAAAVVSVVMSEGVRIHLRPQLDDEIKAGNFKYYSTLLDQFESLISESMPNYPFSRSLASTLIDTAMLQMLYISRYNNFTDKECIENGSLGYLKSLIPGGKNDNG
jgi:AcrR family transcriptional regulator